MAFRQKKQKTTSNAESNNINGTKIFIKTLSDMADKIYKNFLIVSEYCGVTVITASKSLSRVFVDAVSTLWKLIEKPTYKMWIRVYKVFKRTIDILVEPYFSFKNYFSVIKRKLKEAEEVEHLTARKVILKTIKEGIKRNHSLMLKTIVNYSMPALSIIVLSLIVNYASTLTFAVDVKFNNNTIGVVENEYVYNTAQNMLVERVVADKDNKVSDLLKSAKLTLKLAPASAIVKYEDNRIDIDKQGKEQIDQFVDKMVISSDEDIMDAVGVFINGKLLGSVTDRTRIDSTLNGILNSYKKKNSAKIEFDDKVDLKPGTYLTESLKDENSIINLLKSNKAEQKTYKVKKGNTPSGLAEKFNIPLKQFYKLNPSTKKRLVIGQVVKVTAKVPFLSVKEVRRERYSKSISYDTKYVTSSSYLKGYTKVTKDGERGKAIVTADVTYVNGIESGRKIIAKKITKRPTTKLVTRGTKTIYSSYSVGKSAKYIGGGQFMWPVNGGYVSSPYGGGRRHKGMDIASPAGTSIYAAASGKVKLATWYSGYGKCIIIDHGNGIQTLYGHCSALFVSPGQYVSKGQNIAAVGSTGWSTGNHCHFEIRVNGSTVNPAGYVHR